MSGCATRVRWASRNDGRERDSPQTVRVYPNIEEAQKMRIYLIRSRQIELEKRLKRQRGHGREFESLRDYRDGDEFRDISWSVTARRGKLITKVHQIERSQTIWLVLDAGRLLRARVDRLTKLDYTISAALSLAQVAFYSGDRVALLAYGRKPQQRVGPGRGVPHLRVLMESMAQVRAEAFEADHLLAAESLLSQQSRRSLIVWLTDLAETAATPEVIECAAKMATPAPGAVGNHRPAGAAPHGRRRPRKCERDVSLHRRARNRAAARSAAAAIASARCADPGSGRLANVHGARQPVSGSEGTQFVVTASVRKNLPR